MVFRSAEMSLALESATPLSVTRDGVACEITLGPARAPRSCSSRCQEDYVPRPTPRRRPARRSTPPIEYWRRWVSQSRYQGRWREVVHRSALTLKLLTYRPTGGIVAAPTTSLPEHLGGVRNWDYRYTWIRDAAVLALRPAAARLHGGGSGVHGLAARTLQRGATGRARAVADHVRDRRPLGARRRRC